MLFVESQLEVGFCPELQNLYFNFKQKETKETKTALSQPLKISITQCNLNLAEAESGVHQSVSSFSAITRPSNTRGSDKRTKA